MSKDRKGEGNRDADRRYREGVRKTVDETTEEERERKARKMPPQEQAEARRAEERGKSKARS